MDVSTIHPQLQMPLLSHYDQQRKIDMRSMMTFADIRPLNDIYGYKNVSYREEIVKQINRLRYLFLCSADFENENKGDFCYNV